MLWACAIFVWVPFLGEGDVLAFAVICVLSGASLGADLAIPASMQADVLDLDQVESGRRRTAFFFALWSMAGKLALAFAVGIAFPVLGAWASPPMARTPPHALIGLKLLYALCPVLSSSQPRRWSGASSSTLGARKPCARRSKPPPSAV